MPTPASSIAARCWIRRIGSSAATRRIWRPARPTPASSTRSAWRGILAERGEKVVWDKDGKKQVVGSVGDAAEIQAAIKKDDWNDYVIIAKGNHLQHFINGKQTVDVTDEYEAKRAKSGVLALQLHAGPPMTAQFKNIRLKKL